ncbi:acyl-CoA reductase [Alteromonas sp. ASW11-36]|uniref:Acyl-CoA reductase n=1 Tax=Alteromonas arenosi TaxID=3055817 RepID=A0ABT7SVC3_9ALTE|nr:acyl-CoA reductase [Alteromonas sp. ASW11-36]MDM7860143.1 acyl-CoA reductase [Alteromonas sp. ASW11-36]
MNEYPPTDKDDITLLAPSFGSDCDWLNEVQAASCMPVKDAIALSFVKALSKSLLDPKNKNFPEIVALGFWLRNVSCPLTAQSDAQLHKPIGLTVHFAPGNVDTMFVYSWCYGLLLGNKNIVRLASQVTPIQSALINAINALLQLPEFAQLAARNKFVQYPKTSNWTARLSAIADARVIWGGDTSVNSIRAYAAKPRTRDICFADRVSAAILNGDELDNNDKIAHTAQRLLRDTLPYDQQACSSPRMIFWQGSTSALTALLESLAELLNEQIQPSLTRANEQLVFSQYAAANNGAEVIWRGQITAIVTQQPEAVISQHLGQWCFIVIPVTQPSDIGAYITDRFQTLTYAGYQSEEIATILTAPQYTGIDRVVPIGEALDFNYLWDGIDLLSGLTRVVNVR